MNIQTFFCTCPRGLEQALHEELLEISQASNSLKIGSIGLSGVNVQGQLHDAHLLNLHSRIASRILIRLDEKPYASEHDLYQIALKQNWEDWFSVEQTIRVDINAHHSPLKSLQFAALKIKDAICDRFREKCGARPSVDTYLPNVRIVVFVDKQQCTIYLDSSGESLFKRGWRNEKGAAPLRENLAAGLLRLSGWQVGTPLLDPMCGSGTILIEAAQIAAGIAPGSQRRFAFEHLRPFAALNKQWQALKQSAQNKVANTRPLIFGSDIAGSVLSIVRNNLERAGVSFEIPLKQIDIREINPPTEQPGIVLTNPPYGIRISARGGEIQQIDEALESEQKQFWQQVSKPFKERFSGWQVYFFSGDLDLPTQLRLKPARKIPLFNGAIECRLFRFDMLQGSFRKDAHSGSN